MFDLYEVLGCTKESTYEDIRRAYHGLALQFHPDKSDSESSVSEFQRILEAWKILGNPDSREEYDASCKQAELDSESILVYARLSAKELLPDDEVDDALSYQCRCGSKYYVRKADLSEKDCSVHVPCQECTFVIVVET